MVDNKLTENFTLREFERSGYARRHGIDNHIPNLAVYMEIKNLAIQLQIFRDIIGKAVNITSGFRCTKLNRKIGGSLSSQHQIGMAADIYVSGMTSRELFNRIRDYRDEKGKPLDYDQLIHEKRINYENDKITTWVHYSTNRLNRHEVKDLIVKD